MTEEMSKPDFTQWIHAVENSLSSLPFSNRVSVASACLQWGPNRLQRPSLLEAITQIHDNSEAANEVASSEFRAVPSGGVDVGGQDMEKSLSLAALAMSAIYSLPCGADPGHTNIIFDSIYKVVLPIFLKEQLRVHHFQVGSELGNALISTGAWNVVSKLLEGMQGILDNAQGSKLEIDPTSIILQDKNIWSLEVVEAFLPCLLTTLGRGVAEKGEHTHPEEVHVIDQVKKLVPLALRLMLSESKAERQSAIQKILPHLIDFMALIEPISCRDNMKNLWDVAQTMLRSGGVLRCTALRAIIQFSKDLGVCHSQSSFDAKSDPEFWCHIRTSLMDSDELTQKRARFILEQAWATLPTNKKWKQGFLAILDLLDEFAVHLIKQKWSLIDTLQTEEHSTTVCLGNSEDSALEASTPGPLWMEVLWRKAFIHKNPQVQKLAARSFLQRKWSTAHLASIRTDFVFNSLLPILDVALIHKDPELDHKEAIESFLIEHVATLIPEDQYQFMMKMLEMLSGGVSRIAIKCWVASFASLARNMKALHIVPTNRHGSVIGCIRGVIIYMSSFHGVAFRANLFQDFLEAIGHLLPNPEVDPLMVASSLCEIPEEFLFPGTLLHGNLVSWLASTDRMQDWVQSGLGNGLKNLFMAEEQTEDSVAVFSDLKVWEKTAKRLSVLYGFLVSSGREASDILETIVQKLQDSCLRTYLSYGSTSKALLLLQSILKVAINESGSNRVRKQILSIVPSLSKQLTNYTRMSMRDLWENKIEAAAGDFKVGMGTVLAPARWSACKRAYLSVDCLMKTALCTSVTRENQAASGSCPSDVTTELTCIIQAGLQMVIESLHRIVCQVNQLEDVKAEMLIHQLRVLRCLCQGIATIAAENATPAQISTITGRVDLRTAIDSANLACEDVCAKGSVKQSLELARWEYIAAVVNMSDRGWCDSKGFQSSEKAHLLRNILEGFEYAQDSLLVALLDCIKSLLRDLATDDAFTSHAESVLEVKGYDGILWEVVRKMWSAFVDAGKKSNVCSAFMEVVFLRQNFACQGADDVRWNAHGEAGPFPWLIEKLVGLGEQSPRVMFLTAVKLTSELLLSPALVEYYLPSLLAIILYGTTDKGHTEHQAEVVHQGEDQSVSSGCGLVGAYAATRVGPRVAVVCFIYELAQLAEDQPNGEPSTGKQGALAGLAGRKLWSYLLHEALTDPLQCLAQYNIGSRTHRMKTRLWQAVCVSCNFLTKREDIRQSLASLKVMLTRGNVSSVRMFIEATMVKLLLDQPDLLWETIMPFIESYTQRHESLPSYMLIGLQVSLVAFTTSQRIYVLNALLPWALSHHHATRAFAQLAVSKLKAATYPEIRSSESCQSPQPTEPLRSISEYLDRNDDVQRLLSTLGGGVDSFPRKQLCTPKSVFVSCTNLAGLADEEITQEGAPESLLQSLRDYLSQERAKVRIANREQITAKEAGSVHYPSSESRAAAHGRPGSGHFQRKIMPAARLDEICGQVPGDHQEKMLSTLIGLDSPFESTEDLTLETRKRGLIVVATLIDKVPNLAGLARTCEVFGAHSLVVSDASVTKDRLFTAVSMTAEQWLPITEVKPTALLPWLGARREEGYVLVGLEQTSESIPLGEFKFPFRCVVVLGQEKEGISADVLQMLDSTIEIPQVGIVRSLNVHVSGAVAIYEYSRQMNSKGANL